VDLRLVILVGVGLFLGCRSTLAPTADVPREEIVRQIDDRRRELIAAVERLDFDKVSTFFSTAEDVAYAGGGSMAPSRRAALRRYQGIFGALKQVDIDIGQSTIAVLGPEAAVITMQGRVATTDTAGLESQAPFVWTIVWVRSDGEWKMLHANQSYPLNIAPDVGVR